MPTYVINVQIQRQWWCINERNHQYFTWRAQNKIDYVLAFINRLFQRGKKELEFLWFRIQNWNPQDNWPKWHSFFQYLLLQTYKRHNKQEIHLNLNSNLNTEIEFLVLWTVKMITKPKTYTIWIFFQTQTHTNQKWKWKWKSEAQNENEMSNKQSGLSNSTRSII